MASDLTTLRQLAWIHFARPGGTAAHWRGARAAPSPPPRSPAPAPPCAPASPSAGGFPGRACGLRARVTWRRCVPPWSNVPS